MFVLIGEGWHVLVPVICLTMEPTLRHNILQKFSTISLYATKLYVTQSFAIASSVTYSEIFQKFSNRVLTVQYTPDQTSVPCMVPNHHNHTVKV